MDATEFFDDIPDEKTSTYDDDVYKKWFRTGSRSGFLSLRTWLDAGKVSIDIGEVEQGKSLKNSTQVWCNAVELAVYLRAVRDNRAENLYPKRSGLQTAESFVYYGGATVEGKPVSRVLKVHHWQIGSGENARFDNSAFVWKTGHFAARKTDSGAFVPDHSKMLSSNLIKMSRVEMAEMLYRLDLAIHSFANQTEDVFRALNGNRR